MKSLRHNGGDITKLAFAIIFLCAVFMRVFALFASDNFHGIAAGKIICAKTLLEQPWNVYSWIVPAHGPVHLYLLAACVKIFSNVNLTPRILSLAAALLSLVFYYRFLKDVLDVEIALICLFIAAFFPLHIVYSVLSTAEAVFLCFLFLGLFFYTKQKEALKINKYLFFSAFSLSLATLCRFEGGLFIIILAGLLLPDWKKAVVFLFVSGILPALWMIFNLFCFGDPLFFFNASDKVVRSEFEYLRILGIPVTPFKKITFWIFAMSDYFGKFIFSAGILGVLVYGWKKENRFLFLLFSAALFYFGFKTFKEELAFQPRYGMSLGFLFLPFFAVFFREFLLWLKNVPLRKTLFLCFLMMFMFRSSYVNLFVFPHTPDWIIKTAAFLRENAKKGDLIFIEAQEDNYKEPVKLLSGISADAFVDFETPAKHIELMPPSSRKNLKYVVFIAPGGLDRLKEVFRVADCKIYELINDL